MGLSLSFLGTFRAMVDDQPASFATDRARALLAYLAVEADRPHRREVLADMLWPDRPEPAARKNLSQTLTRLRRAIDDYHADPPLLLISAKALQFNASAAHLDVAHFEELMRRCAAHTHPRLESCPACADRLEQAASMYGGDFLQGLLLSDSQVFEEWSLLKREQLHRQVLEALQALGRYHQGRGAIYWVKRFAERQLTLEPWREEAHRQLMRALALSGQRSEALAQYRTCRRILAEELGIDPEAETTALYRQIRDGQIGPQATLLAVRPPAAPVGGGTQPRAKPAATFVGRARELERLNGFLDQALAGRGQVVFITGETGSGKSTLAQEFVRRAQKKHADLVMAVGACNPQTGQADPYLPFREMLSLLSGQIEAAWAEGTISGENAARLSALTPVAAPMLTTLGPDLVGSFLSSTSCPARGSASATNTSRPIRDEGLHHAPDQAGDRRPPGNLFQQYTAVLQALAARQPLLLVLHGLHWADASSASLLFHFAQHLGGSRILLLATFRPEDMATDWAGKAHPLREVIGELKRERGDVQIDLDRATRQEGRGFVDALLDSEPNRLSEGFRQTLFALTGGHALFTVELVREMKDCGDLRLDAKERWVEGPALKWERLPMRVEGVIEKRLARLAPHLRQALRVASVEGQEFTAEVVARVQGLDEKSFIRTLSAHGVRRHRLLALPSLHWLEDRHLSKYRFRHHLFQRYLYQTLDEAERVLLHGEVGRALEAIYGDEVGRVAGQLARHFEAAGWVEKAIDQLIEAGQRAHRLSAPEETIGYVRRGLELLAILPEGTARSRQERAFRTLAEES